MKDNKDKPKQSMIKMYNVADFYQIIDKVGRGTYGSVYKAKGIKDGRFYAIKKLENNDTKLQQEGFPITALRQITLLKQIDHPNIIKLKEIIVSRPNKRNQFRGSTFLVFQYMDHDFAGLFKIKIKFSLPQIKCIVKQLLEGVAYLHKNKILHRDIKSANILFNDQGEVKLADFGLGRKVRFQNMFTYKVVTLWYRAPELLLGLKTYSHKIDVWSVGCVVAQFFTGEVLFKKQTQYAQMQRIYQIVGDFQANQMKITEQSYKTYHNLQDLRPRRRFPKDIGSYFKKYCPSISQVTIDFIDRLLRLDPNKRMSCEQALRHQFFDQKPLACSKSQIQKMQYQCHEMHKDHSVKIQRLVKVDEEHEDKMNKLKENRQPRDNKDVKEHKERDKEPEDRKYPRNYRDDKQYRGRQFKGRQNRFHYDTRKHQKYRSSEEKSSYSRKSDSYSSSSKSSQYSSSSRSRSRSRHNERRTKEDRRSRDQYKRNRDSYPKRDEKRKAERKDDRRDYDKFDRQRKGDYERKDKFYKNEKEQRYTSYKDQRRKEERLQGKRQYRDQRTSFKKDEKFQDKREDYKDDKQRKEERKDDRQRKEDRQRSEVKQRKDQKRGDERKDYRDKREEWKRDSRQRKYQKYQKPTYQSKGRYYEERDYKRRQQKWVQKNVKGDEEKYSDTIKHGDYYRKDDGSQKRVDNKYYFVSGKDPYRKKGYRDSHSSSRSSNHRYKKEKEYSRKPISYQRKNYYKKSHSDSNDHRNH